MIKSKQFDWAIFSLLLLVMLMGIVAIYSASTTKTEHGFEVQNYYIKQMVWMLLSLLVLAAIQIIPKPFFEILIIPGYLFSIFLLVIVLLAPEINGSHRWIALKGFNLQPSELAKITTVMMLAKFKQKITQIAQSIEGVKSVETKLGKNYYSNTMVKNLEVETPLRLLLVDDEKEFVQTLSERLKLRQFPSEIAYDGEQALEFTDKEDTEVMILDLKMPGIDGIEVLKKIKETRPEIEVIILTGHGSDQDRKTCMELGAFAYLEKPADIDLLTATMKKAYEKINKRKKTSAGIE